MVTDIKHNTSVVLNIKIVWAYYDNITYETAHTVGGFEIGRGYFDLYYNKVQLKYLHGFIWLSGAGL